MVGLTVVLAGLSIGTAIRINADRTRIADAKEKSDQRLKLYKETVSRFVNRSPQLLEGVPLAGGARNELVALTDQLLQKAIKSMMMTLGHRSNGPNKRSF